LAARAALRIWPRRRLGGHDDAPSFEIRSSPRTADRNAVEPSGARLEPTADRRGIGCCRNGNRRAVIATPYHNPTPADVFTCPARRSSTRRSIRDAGPCRRAERRRPDNPRAWRVFRTEKASLGARPGSLEWRVIAMRVSLSALAIVTVCITLPD